MTNKLDICVLHHHVWIWIFLRFIVTCGNDGDVRIFEGLDDDDPKFISVGEKAYSLALKVGSPVSFWQI